MPMRKRRGLETEEAALPPALPPKVQNETSVNSNIHLTSGDAQRGLERKVASDPDKEGRAFKRYFNNSHLIPISRFQLFCSIDTTHFKLFLNT